MSELFSLRQLQRVETSASFVDAADYGTSPPPPDASRYCITANPEGSYSLRVRGFRDGSALPALIAGAGIIVAIVDETAYRIETHLRAVSAISDEERATYFEAMQQPELDNNSLIRVLEDKRQGQFQLRSPTLSTHNADLGSFIYQDPDSVGLGWGMRPLISATIRTQGPHFNIVPNDVDNHLGLRVCSLTARITDHPIEVCSSLPLEHVPAETLQRLTEGIDEHPSVQEHQRQRSIAELVYGQPYSTGI